VKCCKALRVNVRVNNSGVVEPPPQEPEAPSNPAFKPKAAEFMIGFAIYNYLNSLPRRKID
jgi:hypothetical protein